MWLVHGKTQPLYGILIEFTSSFYGEGKRKKEKKSSFSYQNIILFLPTVKEGRQFVGKMTSPKMHRFEIK